MSEINFTETEQQYLDCDVPMLSGGTAAMRVIGGFFASFGQSLIMPSTAFTKMDKGLFRAIREIRYTKYKKAVLKKQEGTLTEKDKKTLKRLNKYDFILAPDIYNSDEFTRKIYEEYMRKQEEYRMKNEEGRTKK